LDDITDAAKAATPANEMLVAVIESQKKFNQALKSNEEVLHA
jgi:hypothetical protein